MQITASLRDRIELFRGTASVFHVPLELFAENSWIEVLLGQGIMPKRHHPAADVMSDAELVRFLGDLRANVDNTVRQMPAHMDYLRGYCPGEPPTR